MEINACRIQPLSGASEGDENGTVRRRGPEKYTVWMRSLVLNGHGCTIYSSDGRVVYRVDNYACRRRREVYVMDSAGTTLITLLLNKTCFGVLNKTWQGYYSTSQGQGNGSGGQQPWFTVDKAYAVLRKEFRALVRVAAASGKKVYRIDGAADGSGFTVSDAADGEVVVAEMRRKETTFGVALGDDVMSLTVGPTVDRLLVVGLVVLCGLQLA